MEEQAWQGKALEVANFGFLFTFEFIAIVSVTVGFEITTLSNIVSYMFIFLIMINLASRLYIVSKYQGAWLHIGWVDQEEGDFEWCHILIERFEPYSELPSKEREDVDEYIAQHDREADEILRDKNKKIIEIEN